MTPTRDILFGALEGVLGRTLGKPVRRKHLVALTRGGRGSGRRYLNLALAELERRAGRESLRARPYTMLLDPTNACNLRCPQCLTGRGLRGRPEGAMTLDQFRRIFDPAAPHLLLLELNHWGEPLLAPESCQMLAHARARGVATSLATNGTLLSEARVEKLLDARPDMISLGIDGVTTESHGQHRVGADLEQVLGGLRRLRRRRDARGLERPLIEWQFIVFRHNEGELQEAARLAREVGADHFAPISGYSDDPGWAPRAAAYREPTGSHRSIAACSWPWTTITVNWDGGVSPCCFGFDQRHDLGNLLRQPLERVWNGPRMRLTRRLVAGRARAGEGGGLLCRACLADGRPTRAAMPEARS